MSDKSYITPEEFLEIQKEQNEVIKKAQATMSKANALAARCPMPQNCRPATADDIVPGAVIWYEREKRYGGNYWQVVDKPLHYGSAFKAYTALDGSRYGLDGAYVEYT